MSWWPWKKKPEPEPDNSALIARLKELEEHVKRDEEAETKQESNNELLRSVLAYAGEAFAGLGWAEKSLRIAATGIARRRRRYRRTPNSPQAMEYGSFTVVNLSHMGGIGCSRQEFLWRLLAPSSKPCAAYGCASLSCWSSRHPGLWWRLALPHPVRRPVEKMC